MTDQTDLEPKGTPGAALVAIDQAPFTFKTIQAIASTDLVPKALRNNPEGMLAVILAGREFGLPPMASLRQIDLIEGTPAPSGELLLSLIRKAGHTVIPLEVTSERAVVKGIRDPHSEHPEEWTFEFTIEDAERIMVEQWVGPQNNRHKESSPITEKSNWKNYPQFMLFWRAVTGLARMFFSDVVQGFAYVAEELSDGDGPFQVPEPTGEWSPQVQAAMARHDPTYSPPGSEEEVCNDDGIAEAEIVEEDDPGRPFPEPSGTPSGTSPEPDSTTPSGDSEAEATIHEMFPGSATLTSDQQTEDEAGLWNELYALTGEVGWVEQGTVGVLKANTKRIYQLASLLSVWPPDAYVRGVGVFAANDPEVSADSRVVQPVRGMSGLKVKGFMARFAGQTVGWMRNELAKRTEED